MPGNSGALVWSFDRVELRSLAMRFSRSSSLTLRARRDGVNSLARRAPRVCGRGVAMSKYRCLVGMKGSDAPASGRDLRGMKIYGAESGCPLRLISDLSCASVDEELDARD